MFATVVVTTNADMNLNPRGIGLADMFGAAYPANAELFTNSVFWASGREELIAASPRVQDTRRIDAIEPTQLSVLSWILRLAGPVVAIGAGLTIWFIRRRD